MKRIKTHHVQTLKTTPADYPCSACRDLCGDQGPLESLLELLGLI